MALPNRDTLVDIETDIYAPMAWKRQWECRLVAKHCPNCGLPLPDEPAACWHELTYVDGKGDTRCATCLALVRAADHGTSVV